MLMRFRALLVTWADPDFVGPEAYIILVAFFKKKNTKLGTKVNFFWKDKRSHKKLQI